jgi:hypothetical protein
MDKLKVKIENQYSEYLEFEKIVDSKNKAISKKESTIKDSLKDKSIEEMESILLHVYVDTILYNKDLQILFFKLLTNIETYLEFSKEPLSEEIISFYNNMKNWAPKRIFMVEKEELVETEEGTLETARKEFLESDFFKGLLNQVKE